MHVRSRSAAATPGPVFEQAIHTLFWYGQLPVIGFSILTIMAVAAYFQEPFEPVLSAAIVTGFFALIFSFGASALRTRRQLFPLSFLLISLLLTVIYLHLLVLITNTSRSPFVHIYLYMPAIILMVAQRRTWAEILGALACLLSFMINCSHAAIWTPWDRFHRSLIFEYFEWLFIAVLLTLLILVNHRMERTIRDSRA